VKVIKALVVFVGGGIGSVFRYAMAAWMYALFGAGFPYGTFAVNIIGSFVIGLFLTVAEGRFLVSPDMRAFVAIGILGGFTTFSTFTFETLGLFKDGSFFMGALNIVASITVALFAAWLGNLIGKMV
jgi:fluoride exporter